MFDTINQTRLSAAERVDKADYYKVLLENERLGREQADKEIIDLLHDVKQRYDSKLSSYMARKQTGDSSANKKKAEKSEDKVADINGWGDEPQQAESSPQDDDWGTVTEPQVTKEATAGKKKNKAKGKDKASSKNDEKAADKSEENVDNSGWGEEKTNENSGWGEEKTTENNGWGDEKAADNSGWGDESQQAAPPPQDDDWGTVTEPQVTKEATTGKKKKDKGKSQDDDWGAPATTQSSQKATPVNKSQKKPGTIGQGEGEKQATPQPTQGTTSEKVVTSARSETAVNSKEFQEMKSHLLTTKLDLRLLERDKSKLTEEASSLKSERDELLRKLNQANQDQDTMKVKVRGLTVDLLSANEEIHKLNERIDELEAQQRNRERDVSKSETSRRSMESKYKAYQQQIAELESELSLIKEEKIDFQREASELKKRNDRLEKDLGHSKTLIRTLREGCSLVEDQAKTFEIRHDTVVMSKADLERELVAIKEESSRHITTINKLQKSNEQISKAFIVSVEAHDSCKKELEVLQHEYARKLEGYQVENLRLIEANNQLRKLIDYMQKKR